MCVSPSWDKSVFVSVVDQQLVGENWEWNARRRTRFLGVEKSACEKETVVQISYLNQNKDLKVASLYWQQLKF